MAERRRLGLIGGRGYAGEALLRLLAGHRGFELAYCASASLAGQRIGEAYPGLDLSGRFIAPEAAPAHAVDLVVLALPNGQAAPHLSALGGVRLLDFSADHRFDPDWAYGLTELNADGIAAADRVANPGCYATGAQLALAPLAGRFAAAPAVFAVSGYSGAGRRPSARNDPQRLADNLLPYALSGHVHEREISEHLGHAVRFMPHVAAFFRGISLTCSIQLVQPISIEELIARYRTFYRDASLIDVVPEPPEIRAVVETPRAAIGGFTVDERDSRWVTVVCCLDNLLKGAASQALQNLNLMCGFPPDEGL